MFTEMQNLKYTKEVVPVIHYDTGLQQWEGVYDAYHWQTLRNKVVCRIDACQFWEAYFTKETIDKYRPVLLMLAKAEVTDPTQFCNVIKEFIQMDSRFKEKIHDIFYSCPEDVSFGSYIIQALADVLVNAESKYRTFFRKRTEVVICLSDGYLYFSFDDNGYIPMLPDNVDCEVISNVKNWNGQFRFWESGV